MLHTFNPIIGFAKVPTFSSLVLDSSRHGATWADGARVLYVETDGARVLYVEPGHAPVWPRHRAVAGVHPSSPILLRHLGKLTFKYFLAFYQTFSRYKYLNVKFIIQFINRG